MVPLSAEPIGVGPVTLRPATEENRAALEALRTAPGQEAFINSVAEAFAEADDEPDGRAIPFGLYDGEELIGFVMISDEVGNPSYVAHYLWKLLVDAEQQRKGYGKAALELVAEYFRSRGVDTMWTSAGEGDGSPIPFYERYGFVRQGRTSWGEVMLRLHL
jgi:diamine N-acetyltransferase